MTALFLAGCQKPALPPAPGPLAATNHPLPYLDHAQPRLTTIKLWIGAKDLVTELALTEMTPLLETERVTFVSQ